MGWTPSSLPIAFSTILETRRVEGGWQTGVSGGKKDPESQRIARTAPNMFLNNSRGLPGHYPVKQGYWGKSRQKVHPNVRQNLCHTVSLWYLFCPQVLSYPVSVQMKLAYHAWLGGNKTSPWTRSTRFEETNRGHIADWYACLDHIVLLVRNLKRGRGQIETVISHTISNIYLKSCVSWWWRFVHALSINLLPSGHPVVQSYIGHLRGVKQTTEVAAPFHQPFRVCVYVGFIVFFCAVRSLAAYCATPNFGSTDLSHEKCQQIQKDSGGKVGQCKIIIFTALMCTFKNDHAAMRTCERKRDKKRMFHQHLKVPI